MNRVSINVKLIHPRIRILLKYEDSLDKVHPRFEYHQYTGIYWMVTLNRLRPLLKMAPLFSNHVITAESAFSI